MSKVTTHSVAMPAEPSTKTASAVSSSPPSSTTAGVDAKEEKRLYDIRNAQRAWTLRWYSGKSGPRARAIRRRLATPVSAGDPVMNVQRCWQMFASPSHCARRARQKCKKWIKNWNVPVVTATVMIKSRICTTLAMMQVHVIHVNVNRHGHFPVSFVFNHFLPIRPSFATATHCCVLVCLFHFASDGTNRWRLFAVPDCPEKVVV